MSKEQSNFAHNFKRTTAGGVDTRTLRAHRRSIEWKQSRDQVVSRRRNVGDMSPVPESKGAEQKAKETQKKSRSGDADLDKAANRKAQLMKWKEQKDLRKKVEELEKARKKPFRVVHIEPEIVPFKTCASKPPQVAAASDAIAASVKPPTTRSKTVGGTETKHDVPASRSTRSKVAPVAAGSAAGVARSTRETRSKSSSVAPKTEILGKAQKVNKSNPEPKISDKAKPTKASSVKLSNGIGKIEPKTTAAPERATRSRTRATVVSGAKAVAPSSSSQIHLSSTSSSSKEIPKVFDFSYSKMKRVNLKRGAEPSFAPADFRFKAPENLKPFSFDKLNSSNETSDVQRKTSVIEISTDEGSFSSGGKGTVAAKRQMRKSTKITSTPRVSEIQEERLRTPAVSVVPSLAIVPASDCVVLIEKLQEPISSHPGEEDDGHVGPVFSVMKNANERSRRKSRRRSLSASPVNENPDGDRSRSNIRQHEDGMDDSQRDDTSPDEPQRSRRSLRKQKSNGVATRPVLGQLADSNDVDFVAKTSVEKMGASNVASKETSSRSRRSAASKEVVKRIEGSGLKSLGPDSLKRKTPKNVQNSLILRNLSPEEGVEVLKNSPMVELNRRKLKTPPTGSRLGSQTFPVAPMPNFDDIDVDTDLSKDGSADRPSDILSSFDTESAIVSSSTSVEPLETDDPPFANGQPIANGHADSGPVASSPGKDVDAVGHFCRMLSSETDRLRMLCSSWKEMLISDAEQINEEVSGQIRTTIGQAELLMGQRFKQFSGLVDDCEFKTSEKEVNCTDLQGFWDMIYYQVEDVDKKFSDLVKLKSVNWVMESLPLPVKPKATKKKVAKGTEATLAAKKKSTARPNFAQFRQKLQQQQGQDAESKVIGAILVASPTAEVKAFDGGFFKVDSPAQKKTDANSTEKRSSLLDVGNTPKATSVARVVLQRMTRKSLIQSMQDSEKQDLTAPSSDEINVKNASPILPDEEQRMAPVKRNKPKEKSRRSTRKSVYFSEVVTDCDTSASNFSKYLMPSSDSVSSTPDLSFQLEEKSLLAENTPVINVDVDEVPAKGFKGLKLGFTPGVDGKSRRISSFTPLSNVEKASGMNTINEKAEIISDLMTFSPLTCTTASSELSGESGRKSQAQRRCSTRRSVANKSRMSLL